MGKNSNLMIISTTFLACLIFGLFVINYYTTHELPYGIEPLEDEGVMSLTKFVGILVVITIIILLIIKIGKLEIWKVLYFLGTSAAMMISLYLVSGNYAIIIAPIIAWIKMHDPDEIDSLKTIHYRT